MKRGKILIVEDELIARENLDHVLTKEGYDTVAVESGVRAFKELERQEFDLVLTDLRMQQVDGMQVLEHTKELDPDTEVVVITGFATVSTAVEAMQKGAYHYLPKPYKIDEVRILVRKALEKRWLRLEVTDLKRQVQSQKAVPFLVGKSPQIEALKQTIEQIARTEATVLILGETGTGKELVAKAIHHLSLRAEKRFLAINCGAFSEELLANELFGHEKEAFTGARGVKKGLLEVASGGTVLLDEIGEMPQSMQVKLLRVLQEKTLMRVGGTSEIPVDIRVLAATNKDLKGEVERGNFRQDLYYRINVVTLHVPNLTERQDDIPLLVPALPAQVRRSPGEERGPDRPGGHGGPAELRIPRQHPGAGKHHGAGRHPVHRRRHRNGAPAPGFPAAPDVPDAAPPETGIPHPGGKRKGIHLLGGQTGERQQDQSRRNPGHRPRLPLAQTEDAMI